MNKPLPTMIRLAILSLWCLTTTAEAQLLASSTIHQKPRLAQEFSGTVRTGNPAVRALSDVLLELEKKYGIKFAFQRKILQDKTVSLPLPATADREAVLKAVLKPNNLTFRKVDDQYYVIVEEDEATSRVAPFVGPLLESQSLQTRYGTQLDDRMINGISSMLVMRQPMEIVVQERRVSGRVTAEETADGLPGVSVAVKSTTRGTTTDASGNFALSIPNEGGTLVFSFIGYVTQEIPVGSQSTINVVLKQSDQTLNEIVVVGYGTQQKRDVTGSIASISTKSIKDQPVPNIVEGLTGRLPGVLIQQSTGAPGNSPSIKIRGLGSISAGNGPLVVIDGQPLNSGDLANGGGLNLLNPNDIDKIDILKDASATAIYGSRGANGVVVVTTKRGKSGQSRLNFDYYTGVQQITKKMDMLNTQQFAEFSKEAFNTAYLERVPGAKIDDPNSARPAGQRYRYPRGEIAGVNFDSPGNLPYYDYQDMIFQDAPISNYQLSAAGGSEKVQYMVSGNYLKQNGVVKRSGINRYTVRANVDAQVTSYLKMGISLSPSFSVEDRVNTDGHWASNGVINAALSLPPFIPIYQPGTSVYNSQAFYAAPYDWPGITNPVANIYEIDNRVRTTRLLGNAYAEVKLPLGILYRGTIGGDVRHLRQNYYQTSALPLNQLLPPTPNSAYAENSQELNWVTNHTLNYLKQIGETHRIDVLVGMESQKNDFERTRVDANNFPNDIVRTVNAGTIIGTQSARNLRDQWSLASYFGRVAYSYKDRYLANASFRRDGSSRFGNNNRWGTFPSASVGWRVSEESFLKNNRIVSELKIKASYGISGNNAFTSNYPSIGLLGPDNYVLGSALANGLAVNSIGNDNLTWEKSRQTDIGLELGVLSNRIFLTVDYYKRITTDLLLAVQVPTLTGFSSAVKNIGKVENKGLELALNTRNLTGAFTWTTDLNFSFNRNKVLALGPTGDPIRSGTGVGETNITMIGQPLGSFYGYKQLGIFQSQAELDAYPHFADTRPGDVKFEDVNKDGKVDANDRTMLGNNQPDFIYGFTNNFSFKGFDLGVVIQGVQGATILNLSRRFYENLEGNANELTTVLNRWRSVDQPGDGKTPRANTRSTGNNNAISSRWIEDASYFRIRNITLGYNIPKTLVQRVKVQSLRLYGGVQNVLTVSKYLGYNPEVSGYEGPLTGGVDYGSYPLARTYTIGVNIGL